MKNLETLSVSFVLPALNESESIPFAIASIRRANLESRRITYEMIVVDNNSTDSSALIARKCGARVVEEKIVSYGAALITGIRAARYNTVITGDADGSYPFQDSLALLEEYARRNVEFLSTRRLDTPESMTGTSRVGNAFFCHLTRLLYCGNSLPYTDMLSGMWIFERKLMLRLLECPAIPPAISTFSNHIKLLAYLGGLRCEEVPIKYEQRKGGSSKIRIVRDGTRKLFYTLAYRNQFRKLADSLTRY